MKTLPAALVVACVASVHPSWAQSVVRPDADPRIEKLVASVSEERLSKIVETLAGFHTRNTLSDTSSPTRGIGAAREWIFGELTRSSPKLHVIYDTHQIGKRGRITRDVELRNVVAYLPGRSPRLIYVTAHYDTVNIGQAGQIGANTRPAGEKPPPDPQLRADQDYNVAAPGANDNGSGTALTMELARVFAESGIQFEATLAFVLWAGEEQGLVGARVHAAQLASTEAPVDATFNNDIVGNSRGGNDVIDAESVRVYSDGPEDSLSRSLARYVERVSAVYVPSHRVRLMARQDRFSRGSDHTAFTEKGYAAVVFRESNENFTKQHSALDTVDGVDVRYLAQNVRVNAASVAALALAPRAPFIIDARGAVMIGRQPSGYDATLRWNPSPGAVAYRIYWREAWSPNWQRTQLVGNITQLVLPGLSIDDFVFGVAAVDADGHESLVSTYNAPPRRDADIKVLP